MAKHRHIAFSIIVLLAQSLPLKAAPLLEHRALLAYLRVQPGNEQRFLHASERLIDASRKEPGNLIYILHQSANHPQQFVFYELFRTEGDLKSHRNARHTLDFLKEVDPILAPGQFILEEFIPTKLDQARN